jgi:hypothetical protein
MWLLWVSYASTGTYYSNRVFDTMQCDCSQNAVVPVTVPAAAP